MEDMLPFDPVAELRNALAADRRPADGLLHPSGDLIGSLRHAQLTAAGAPTLPVGVTDSMPLILGTLMHRWLEDNFRATPVMNEVKLDAFMPEGWTGTCDALFWDAERRGFVLADYKTCAPEALMYLHRDGIKPEHMWQVSCYWHACVAAGLPMVVGFGVLYLPKGRPRRGDADPVWMEADPLPREMVIGRMEHRWSLTKGYLAEVERTGEFVNDFLAPEQDRVMSRDKDGVVKLLPHFSTRYCKFDNELCSCRTQGETRVGHYDADGVYHARKGYESYVPTV